MLTKHLVSLSLLIWTALFSNLAHAQKQPSALSPDQIRAQAGKYGEYKKLLNDLDPTIRYTAVSEMLKSNDNGLRTLAFDHAFQSAESAVRALALKARIMSIRTLVLQPASKSQEDFQGGLALTLQDQDSNSGIAHFPYGMFGELGDISISGEEITFDWKGLFQGRAHLTDGGRLEGTISSSRKDGTKYVAPILIILN